MRSTIVKTARFLDKYYGAAYSKEGPKKCIRSISNSVVEVPDIFQGKHLLQGFRYEHVCDFPRKVDWFGATDVRDQGIYDTANIFAAVGAVESAYAIFKRKKIRLSVQEAVNFNKLNCGVYGGSIASVFDYIAERRGLCSESDYPYKGLDDELPTSELLRSGEIYGYQKCENDHQFFQALTQQPLAAGIVSSQDFIEHRGEEIFTKIFKSERLEKQCANLLKLRLEQGIDVQSSMSEIEARTRDVVLKECLTDAVLVVGYDLDYDVPYLEALCSRGEGHGAWGLSKISFAAALSMGMTLGASFPVI